MTIEAHPQQKLLLATGASAVGIGISWVMGTPCGLLVPIAALFMFAGARMALSLFAALAVALTGSLLADSLGSGFVRDIASSWGAFFAIALCIGMVVATGAFGPTLVEIRRLVANAGRAQSGATSVVDVSPSLEFIHSNDRPAVAQAFAYAFWTGVPQVIRYRRRQADGSFLWTDLRAEPGYDVDVEVVDLVSKPDERWVAAKSPGETAEAIRAAKVIEKLHGKAWAFDTEGRFTYVTPVAQTAVGMTIDDLNAPVRGGAFIDGGDVGWSRGVHPDDYQDAAAKLRYSLKTGDDWNVEYRMLRATGQYVWHRISARPVRDTAGRITGWYGTSIDIDVYKKTVEALRESERQLSLLVDMVPSHLWRLTPKGDPVFFNRRMIDFIGIDIADAKTSAAGALEAVIAAIHPDDATTFREALNRCLATGESFALRYRLRRTDGIYRWMSSRAEPMRDEDGRIVQWYGLCHDIDDQMRAEEAFRQNAQQLRQLVDAVPAMIWCTAPNGNPTYLSKRHTDATGAALGSVIATTEYMSPLKRFCHPEDLADAEHVRALAYVTGTTYLVRYRQIRSDGTYRWTETRAEPLRDRSGEILQWYGVSVDIHDMVTAQAALSERERELSLLVDMMPSFLWRLTPEGEMTLMNKQMAEFLGADAARKRRIDDALTEIVHPDDAPEVRDQLGRSLATGERFSMRYRLRRADGVYRWMSARAEPLRDDAGRIVQWFGLDHDIDDQIRALETLRQASDKLARASQAASLAELSASIAHEVNQPLAAIMANSHACRRWLSADPPNFERALRTVERITRDVHSAADVVSRIRALFRQEAEEKHGTMLDAVIAEARDHLAEEAARRGVRMEVEVAPDLPLVALDRVQIQQVVINLLRNGFEAMDDTESDKIVRICVNRNGESIQTEVSDLGCGLEAPERIFEPFFTTKSQGMGMGLSICRSIVEAHGGRLWAENNLPRGAIFVFTLPVATKAEA